LKEKEEKIENEGREEKRKETGREEREGKEREKRKRQNKNTCTCMLLSQSITFPFVVWKELVIIKSYHTFCLKSSLSQVIKIRGN